jgi:aminoglycoside phosphotransferase (APT) family kinase protein
VSRPVTRDPRVLAAHDHVARWLLRDGWIGAQSVVDGELVVLDASRRNANFLVLHGDGQPYFVKQETRDCFDGGPRPASVAYEAAVYRLLATVRTDGPLRTRVPRCHAFDAGEQMLLLEGHHGWERLGEYHLRRSRCPPAVARTLAATLAELHAISAEDVARADPLIAGHARPPWVLFLAEPDHWMYINASHATLELLRILQASNQLCRSFEALRSEWRDVALIHGDLKWDNILVSGDAPSARAATLRVVDWELARVGDPCWDVGAAFGAYLDAWLSSIPISADDPPDRFLHLAGFPLERVQPALRAFWSVYRRCARIGVEAELDLLERSTRLAAVRLVQSAFEQLQAEDQMTARAVFLLQLAENIAGRPLEAAVHLLGLRLPRPVPTDVPVR